MGNSYFDFGRKTYSTNLIFYKEIRISYEISKVQEEHGQFEILLEQIMLKHLVPYKCVAIMTDEIYSGLFKKEWFQKFAGFISFVMVNVEDTEDLSAPYNETEEVLEIAIKDGCQLYIILMSNGLQVAELLKYGDRNRLLDTRSKFIFASDKKIFDTSLFYLWKRIVNVVFIDKRKSKNSRTKSNKPSIWYELTTVPFPLPLKDVWVPRRLDIWAKLKFRTGTDLFRDKTYDLKNQTLKVAAFAHIPGTVKHDLAEENIQLINEKGLISSNSNISDPKIFTGTEVEIIQSISKAMRFNCELYEPEKADVELLGKIRNDSNYSGLIGEMTSTNADIALGDLYYIPYILELMDLSVPYNTECLTFLTPEALTDNSWNTLILPFPGIMWAIVILCLLITSLSFYFLAKFHQRTWDESQKVLRKNSKNKTNQVLNKRQQLLSLALRSDLNKLHSNAKYQLMMDQYQPIRDENQPVGLYQFLDPVNSILYAFSMLLLISLPKLPSGWSLRMLTGWYWLYCLLLVVAYKASMTAILSRPTPRVTLDTIQELVDSKLQYGGWGEINKIFFTTSPDDLVRKIGTSFEVVDSSEDAVDRVAAATFAFYENTYFLKQALVKRQFRYQGIHLGNSNNNNTFQQNKERSSLIREDRSLHIMKNCIINMPVSIGLQKNSPIKPRIDKYIRRILEAGLIKKWLDDVMHKIYTAEVQKNIQSTKALMNLRKFLGAIVALFIGYILGITVLIIEILYFKYVTRKKPKNNRYLKKIQLLSAKTD